MPATPADVGILPRPHHHYYVPTFVNSGLVSPLCGLAGPRNDAVTRGCPDHLSARTFPFASSCSLQVHFHPRPPFLFLSTPSRASPPYSLSFFLPHCLLALTPLPFLGSSLPFCCWLTRLALEEKSRPLLHLMRQLRCMQVPPTC